MQKPKSGGKPTFNETEVKDLMKLKIYLSLFIVLCL